MTKEEALKVACVRIARKGLEFCNTEGGDFALGQALVKTAAAFIQGVSMDAVTREIFPNDKPEVVADALTKIASAPSTAADAILTQKRAALRETFLAAKQKVAKAAAAKK